MTVPIVDSLWAESRLVAVSNGAAYERIRTYLSDNQDLYSVYQPVSINKYIEDSEDHVGAAVIPFLDSYQFTFALLQELVTYNIHFILFTTILLNI